VVHASGSGGASEGAERPLPLFPLPNVEGQAGYNFSSQAPANQPRREELLRLDFHPSDRWRFAGPC
jgi:hypothetical protein